MPSTLSSPSSSDRSCASSSAPAVSRWVAGTQDGSITYTPSTALRLELIMYLIPSRPSTLAISWGSITTEVVPQGSTVRANSGIFTIELSICTCPSMKPGAR